MTYYSLENAYCCNRLKCYENNKVVQEVRLNEISQLNLMGNVQLSTQAIQALCQAEIPISYFSMGGWFYGVTQGLGVKKILRFLWPLRSLAQERSGDDPFSQTTRYYDNIEVNRRIQ